MLGCDLKLEQFVGRTSQRLWRFGGAAFFLILAMGGGRAADPSALWHIVNDQCVPDEIRHHDPSPCALVDLSQGVARGYVVLKDIAGATQYLVLPTARIGGIESAQLLAPDAPNFMEDAWEARRFVAAKVPAPLAREDVALAINSVSGRSQDQLHIHVDCLRLDVRAALARGREVMGDTWQPFPELLAGKPYLARRVLGDDLAQVNPFRLVAEVAPDAADHMGQYTLFVAGVTFADGPGFILLADRADPLHGDFGSSETLQDHGCALAKAR
ncbi:MAG TPA: CDP-diacylglycerol diphosphatase [Stellaceae bacterium]|nr:CDP-diacylglycerol diphosphatase [Stellaceae bacterium]